MPEGDTIFRTADRLKKVMNGRRIEAAQSPYSESYARQLPGDVVRDVEARGKHLLIHGHSGWVVHSHMGMTGSWHLYQRDEAWKKPQHYAALVITLMAQTTQRDATRQRRDETPSGFDVIVCFTPKLLELLTNEQMRRHRWLSRLGPDLLSDNFDPAAATQRMRVHARTPIGEAVMNQTIVSGIGNVYKSELLFLIGCNPWRRVEQVSDAEMEELFRQARYWMQENLSGYPRRLRNDLRGERVWVYGRQGKACRRCGTQIRMSRQGDLGRTTYWCPRCQPEVS